VLSVMGRVTSMADAESMIASGLVDMVGATRQLIAEPEFVKNAYYGHEERNRICIACNWCMMAGHEGGAQGCTINPASYRERFWGLDSFNRYGETFNSRRHRWRSRGLEAARVAALRVTT